MKIGYISDVHIDGGMTPTRLNIYDQSVDILIIAGDVGSISQTVSFIDTMIDTFMVPIILVLGNHDYYNDITIEETISTHQKTFEHDNVHLLIGGDSVTIYGQTFIGATLWSDLATMYNPVISNATKIEANKCIADFDYIVGMTPERMISLYQKDRNGIINSLDEHGSDSIVITHFSPSFDCRNEDYPINPLAYYFCGNMDDVIVKYQPKYWIYGHTHGTNDPYDYGDTTVLCNMLFGNEHSMKIIEV